MLQEGLREAGYVQGAEPRPRSLRARKIVRQLRKSDVDQVVRLYQEGVLVAVLARQFGVHRHTVTQHLERRGVVRRPKRKLSDEQALELKHLHHLGISYVELARKYGVIVDTVKREIGNLNT